MTRQGVDNSRGTGETAMDVYEDRRIETAIVLGAAVAMAWRLRIMSWHSEACLLLCASTLAVAADRSWLPRSTAARSHLRCSYRAGASAGIGLGCATPMLVVGALTISRLQHAAATGPLRALLWASALGSTHPHPHPLTALLSNPLLSSTPPPPPSPHH